MRSLVIGIFLISACTSSSGATTAPPATDPRPTTSPAVATTDGPVTTSSTAPRPTWNVVLVGESDAIEGRAEPESSAPALVVLPHGTTGLEPTGATSHDGSRPWRQFVVDGETVWIEDFHVTDATIPTEEEAMAAIDAAVAGFDGDLTDLAPHRGWMVRRFSPWYRIAGLDLAIAADDPTTYAWGGPACTVDECPMDLTLREAILDPVAETWSDSDRVTALNEPIPGPNGALAERVIPPEMIGFSYLALHDPGDDPAVGGLDWVTWYVFLTFSDGDLVIAGFTLDAWAP